MSEFVDLYEVLGIPSDANDALVLRAYRKAALQTHPDKNPNNIKECTKKFYEVSLALDILTDPNKKTLYDKKRRSIHLQRVRQQNRDKKRASLVEQLERREKKVVNIPKRAEINRLSTQGSEIIQNESRRMKDQMLGLKKATIFVNVGNHLSDAYIRQTFEKYGPVIKMTRTKGQSVIMFYRKADAERALQDLNFGDNCFSDDQSQPSVDIDEMEEAVLRKMRKQAKYT